MSIFRINKKTDSERELIKVIKECKKVAAASSKDAKEEVIFIKKSIEQANKDIEACIKDITRQKIRNPEVLLSLKEQLAKIKTAFVQEYDEVEELVEKKIKEANKFNITLFGRTKVGKSTLMVILTNGDGRSIGKGGQRTTLNVRQYNWKGLTITDTPGIDAFNGKTDERMAFDAAKAADIIIFMISDGQPEATEAEWLVRLKREDKPIVCLCNAKRTLNDELDLDIFLDNPNEVLDDKRVHEIIAQFNEFVKELLPNEHIDIYVTQLQARLLANIKKYSAKRDELIKASRFEFIENVIQKIVICNGISFRRKCFLSIIDSPLYNQSLELFNNSASAYKKYLNVHGKMTEFCNWERSFIIEERTQLLERIEQIFNSVIATIPSFVEDNLENEDFSNRWIHHLESENIDKKVQDCYTRSVSKAKEKIDKLFEAMDEESKLQDKFSSQFESISSGGKIANWKRRWGWAGAGVTAIGTVTEIGLTVAAQAYGVATAAAAIPVVGWIVAGGALLFGLLSFFSNSREKKLRKARIEQENRLSTSLNNLKTKTKNRAFKAFQSDIVEGLLKDAYSRFHVVETTLLTLANSQRELALKYLKHHSNISKNIIQAALFDLGINGSLMDHIDFVARIPGKKTIIGCTDENMASIPNAISKKIGNREEVRIFRKSLTGDLESRLTVLRNYFKISVPMTIKSITMGFNQNVVYIPQFYKFKKEEETNLLLLQQILNIHIIKR